MLAEAAPIDPSSADPHDVRKMIDKKIKKFDHLNFTRRLG
jgi:hypothetical protein